MTNNLTADENGRVIACPACDHAGAVYRRKGDNTYIGNPDDPYACKACSATFEEPVKRESRKGNWMKAKYEDLSPEDVGL